MNNRLKSIGRLFLFIGIGALIIGLIFYFLKIMWLTIILGLVGTLFLGACIGMTAN